MSILEYLASRAAFIIFHLFAGALAIAVIQLDLLQAGGPGLTYGSAAYIVVLHVAMLAIAMVIDYSRQYAFFRRAREIASMPDPIAHVPSLPTPGSAEQRILFRLANAAYTSHTAEALKREEQSQMHVDFTNRWVHAMKTPVSVIGLLVQQSKEVKSVDEALPLFDSIQEENERIAHALETMLGMARQERFSVDLLPEQVDLAEVARNVINKHRKEFIRYSIYPSVECHAPPPSWTLTRSGSHSSSTSSCPMQSSTPESAGLHRQRRSQRPPQPQPQPQPQPPPRLQLAPATPDQPATRGASLS